jgi:hypothetical protein
MSCLGSIGVVGLGVVPRRVGVIRIGPRGLTFALLVNT